MAGDPNRCFGRVRSKREFGNEVTPLWEQSCEGRSTYVRTWREWCKIALVALGLDQEEQPFCRAAQYWLCGSWVAWLRS
jgi:hypothetical protein